MDEVEYALPTSEAPTLAELLSSEELENEQNLPLKIFEEPTTCSALQVDFLQAISQQLNQAQVKYEQITHSLFYFYSYILHLIKCNFNMFLDRIQ